MNTPNMNTEPGTVVRSPVFPSARGIFVGVSPSGVLWIAWRRCEAVTDSPDTAEQWASKARTMAHRLDRLHARHVARLRIN
jgi:hypothetical protein